MTWPTWQLLCYLQRSVGFAKVIALFEQGDGPPLDCRMHVG